MMTNSCTVLIVSINKWHQYALPLMKSLEKHEPGAGIVLVDNASDEPYPDYHGHVVRSDKRLSYAAAINYAAKHTDADWLLSINDDTVCNAPFLHLLDGLSDMSIYARQLIKENGLIWFGNWLVLIPRRVWELVGGFDHDFEMCGFEDADYAIRCIKMGITVQFINMPFHHYWGQTRWQLIDYAHKREKNIRLIEKKHGLLLGRDMEVLTD